MAAVKKPFLIPAALLAGAVLCGLIWLSISARVAILRDGTEVTLKTRPIDPRDLLRGRYVRLGYDISTVPLADFAAVFPDNNYWRRQGEPVFVTVVPGPDGFHVAEALHFEKPASGLFLAGRLNGGTPPEGDQKAGSATVTYGIDRFYAAEKVAPEIESRMRNRQITTIVAAVNGDGVAQIKALKQEGGEIFVEPLY